MLRKIRSKYITKNIFSYINEKTKLNLIKFNKKLQKELFIKILNYQILSGRYIQNMKLMIQLKNIMHIMIY